MVVGILTHYNVNNQGAQLQMYAMRNWLENLGHKVVILTYEKNFDFDKSEEQKNSGSVSNFGYYIKHYLVDKGFGLTAFNTLKVLAHKKAFELFATLPYDTKDIDCVIIGSDEVFSIDVGCNKMMYGYGLQVPAIAYAPAFGRSTEELLKEFDCYDLIQEGLSDMFRLSARDSHTQSMIQNMTGRNVPLVCDPVLLYDGKGFKVPVKPIKKKYMIVYSYDRNMVDPKEIKAVKAYAKKHGLITVSLGTYHKWCDRNIVCNAEEWYSYFPAAECVLTDTFHGSVVAMKNHCKAAFFIRESINAFKMESLLEMTGLQKQRLKVLNIKQMEKVFSQEINYAEVDRRIELLAKASSRYLKESLDAVEALRAKEIENKKNITVISEYHCSGCGACSSVCPKNSIKLKVDSAGFYTAVVDEEKCIHCGICQKVCTRYEDAISGIDLHDAVLYASQSTTSSTIKHCSSGGIAHELAVQALRDNKKVVGVIYNKKTNRAEHRIAEQIDQLASFDGSKYLQSNPEYEFRLALREAKQDKMAQYVVFGTPCQIAGLAKSCDLAEVRNQFLLVEVFCHGVPSYKVWDEECKKISKKLGTDQFDSVQFRYKKNDWHSYCLRVNAGEKVFYGSRETELFWQVFFENILLGDSCYKCRMRKEISMADIRLGDYWGQRFQQRSDGVSAVFVCTERGQKALLGLEQKHMLNQLDAGDAAEMLAAQNMDGYHQQELHDKAMKVLRSEDDVMKAVKIYRKGMDRKQKLKRMLLIVSSVLPDDVREKLRKANSSLMMKNKKNTEIT